MRMNQGKKGNVNNDPKQKEQTYKTYITSNPTTIKLLNFNAHSIRAKDRTNNLLNYFLQSDSDIMVTTETWLNHTITPQDKSITILQSPPREQRGEGIMILMKRKSANLQPIHQDLWTSRTICCLCHIKGHAFITVGHYSSPADKAESDKELTFFVNNLQREHPQLDIVVAGDFNRKSESMKTLNKKLNLVVHVPNQATRKGNNSESTIDFCLSNMLCNKV